MSISSAMQTLEEVKALLAIPAVDNMCQMDQNASFSSAFSERVFKEIYSQEYFENTSHVVRTSMNAIMGFAQVLNIDGITKDETCLYTRIICTETEHLLTLFNELLASLKEVNAIAANQPEFSNHV